MILVFTSQTDTVHVAIEQPGLVQTIDPCSGASRRCATAVGAKILRSSYPTALRLLRGEGGRVGPGGA